MSGFGALWLIALLGCGGGTPEEPKGPVPVPGTTSDGRPVSGSVGELPVVSAAPTPGGLPTLPVGAAPEPALSEDACTACSLLLEHEFDELRSGKACELCGDNDPMVCDEGWPEPGTPDCDTYDYLRNCIYARLGYDFDTAEEWRVTFSQEPWYTPDPDFSWSNVTPLQKRNAQVLRDLVKGRRCRR